MSTAPKRKAKTKSARKPKARPVRKRAVSPKRPLEKPVEAPPERKQPTLEKKFLIAVRIKGCFGTPNQIERTLSTLRLRNKFNAVLLENSATVIATLRQAKDYVTWGEANSRDVARILKERGELIGGLPMTDKNIQEKFGAHSVDGLATALTEGRITLKILWQKGLKPVFRLHPPSGGFESSTKRPYGSRGELGQRGPAISSLVARMM